MQSVVMKSATLMIAKSSKGDQEKKLRGERERESVEEVFQLMRTRR